eukprot:15434647-Alexandrium_andersonii.AAC.2
MYMHKVHGGAAARGFAQRTAASERTQTPSRVLEPCLGPQRQRMNLEPSVARCADSGCAH